VVNDHRDAMVAVVSDAWRRQTFMARCTPRQNRQAVHGS
jgi:hypothetical protein